MDSALQSENWYDISNDSDGESIFSCDSYDAEGTTDESMQDAESSGIDIGINASDGYENDEYQ